MNEEKFSLNQQQSFIQEDEKFNLIETHFISILIQFYATFRNTYKYLQFWDTPSVSFPVSKAGFV